MAITVGLNPLCGTFHFQTRQKTLGFCFGGESADPSDVFGYGLGE